MEKKLLAKLLEVELEHIISSENVIWNLFAYEVDNQKDKNMLKDLHDKLISVGEVLESFVDKYID